MNILFLFLIIVILGTELGYCYKVEEYTTVHQHITNQSANVWIARPDELNHHIGNTLETYNDDDNFDNGDKIIDGSAEEDYLGIYVNANPLNHFWNPDVPDNGEYDENSIPLSIKSSWRRAEGFWIDYVKPSYKKGNIEKSYYWLGRIVHLLQDTTVPAHMHEDSHPFSCGQSNDDSLECYTGNNWQDYSYEDVKDLGPYLYEDLIPGFDWTDVEPNDPETRDLFRLFWYTAQKTQYFASDDVDRDFDYEELDENLQEWDYLTLTNNNLWKEEGLTGNNFITMADLAYGDEHGDTGENVSAVADAVMGHAMRATAGLYRLFWHQVADREWNQFCHDERNTCRTHLKGDFRNDNRKYGNFFVEGTDGWAYVSIADINDNGEQDIVMTVNNDDNTHGMVYAFESNWLGKIKKKWEYDIDFGVTNQPTLADTNNDGKLETLFALQNGLIICLDEDGDKKWDYNISQTNSQIGEIKVSDVNLDGEKEIIFTNYRFNDPDYNAKLFILTDQETSATEEESYIIGNGGSIGPVAIADLDKDKKRDIIVSTYYGIKTYEYDGNNIVEGWTTNEGRIEQNAMVFDIDKDNEYEIMYVTTDNPCDVGKTCYTRLYIKNHQGNSESYSPISLSYEEPSNPVAADIDNDGDIEIIVVEQVDASTVNSTISCFEVGGSNCSGYPFDYNEQLSIGTGFSPSISDIDMNGYEEIIVHKYGSRYLYVLSPGMTSFKVPLGGHISNGPAIGDIDNDGNAEIAVPRKGSPFSILTLAEENNTQPSFDIDNISVSGLVGESIYINKSGRITATDPDRDVLEYSYSYPFNESGYWTPTINDTGNWTTTVGVTDFGNLTDVLFVDLKIFANNRRTTFADSSSEKNLTFTGAQTKTVTIRLPKDSTIEMARLNLEGGS